MKSKDSFDKILDFFKNHHPGIPGDAEYDSAFCDCLVDASSAAEASIWRLDSEEHLHLSFGTKISSDDISGLALRKGEGIGGAVVLSRKTIAVPDAWREPSHDRRVDEQVKLRTSSMISAPILFGDVIYGVLYILNHKKGKSFPKEWEVWLSAAGVLYGSVLAGAPKSTQRNVSPTKKKEDRRQTYETTIIGASRAIQMVLRLCLKAGKSNIPVLIQGDTGTGKELAARRIHEASKRAKGPFVEINCAALPETLLESELFGHIKGAFSGANTDRGGKFLSASKGTLFLDEIGEMSPACQAKILRVIEDKKVTPVGSEKTIPCDVRVITATNRDLLTEIKSGSFREDLFYRLCGIEILMPPLRERVEDIPLLATHFLKKTNPDPLITSSMRLPAGLSDQAIEMLVSFDWPGNVRQLEQAVLSAAAICEGNKILPDDFPAWLKTALKKSGNSTPTNYPNGDFFAESRDLQGNEVNLTQDRDKYIKVLESSKYPGTGRWNLTAAARKLNIPRKTFTYRLKKLNLID